MRRGVPVSGEEHVPQSQVSLIYYDPEEDTREEEEGF
jgi:hypothetical protein